MSPVGSRVWESRWQGKRIETRVRYWIRVKVQPCLMGTIVGKVRVAARGGGILGQRVWLWFLGLSLGQESWVWARVSYGVAPGRTRAMVWCPQRWLDDDKRASDNLGES